ncbi:M-phase-specific PLK1-interacting protein [Nematolebias whitei]|uniref:M-phase-specific PLK1-interacting protein n=1 Tax=Nematolebias whitei TaxID=451745 RepID=UPI00189B679E|nr:M-phase-specific PLK1-interacting protein [Nematolebias whitei]
MYRPPVRSPRSPGRFPSPARGWTLPGSRSPCWRSPRARVPDSPGSPRFSSVPNSGCQGFGDHTRNQGFGFRRPQSFSPTGAPNLQSRPSYMEKYFSPSMLQDPWRTLKPISAAEANAKRVT